MFLLVLVVIIPTVMGGWNEFSVARVKEVSTDCTNEEHFCTAYFRKFITSSAFFHPSLNLLIFLHLQALWLSAPCCFCALSL